MQMQTRKLSGAQKIAILLGELDAPATMAVLDNLQLTRAQLNKINVAMRKLGRYDPNDPNKVSPEVQVLQETYDFGAMKGILVPNPSRYVVPPADFIKVTDNSAENNIRQAVANDPDAIAKVLQTLLSEDK